MRKKMNLPIMKLILCFFMLFTLSGCFGGREINDLEIVIGIGVDKDENTGNILLTAQIVREEENGNTEKNGGGENGAFWNVTSTEIQFLMQ